MKFGTGKQIAIVLGLFAAGLATACSDSSTDNPGGSTTGSTTGATGGTTGARSTTSGSTGTTGSSATNSTGGSTNTTGGTNGVTGDGGRATTGGTTGTTGDSGTTRTPLYTFDTDVQGFAVDASQTRLGGDAGVDAGSILGFDGTVGNPSPGSLVINAPFSGLGQQIDLKKFISPTDFSGKVLHVLIRIDSGTGVAFIQPFAQQQLTDDAGVMTYPFYGAFTAVTGAAGTWVDYSLDFTAANLNGLNPRAVTTIGIQIISSQAPTGDAAAPATPTAAVIHIDTFATEAKSAGGTTGGGTTTGGGATTGGASDGGARDGGTTGSTTDGGVTAEGGTTTGGGATTGTTGGATTGTTGGATTGTTGVVDAGTAG